ncbi:hypothetical protein EMCG_03379 [[Emmonsia] crescens]|uniref:Uncharacterized protein n=1 Tax=[Emmonsia] crescens TaxID=73230 RepID=A0A0G2HWH3_9EURO|nr:hypothetical protein EMCG_03379 [Emmonsia crescens UAMH 3008]
MGKAKSSWKGRLPDLANRDFGDYIKMSHGGWCIKLIIAMTGKSFRSLQGQINTRYFGGSSGTAEPNRFDSGTRCCASPPAASLFTMVTSEIDAGSMSGLGSRLITVRSLLDHFTFENSESFPLTRSTEG